MRRTNIIIVGLKLFIFIATAFVFPGFSQSATGSDARNCSVITLVRDKTIKVPFNSTQRFAVYRVGAEGEVKLSDEGEAEIKVKFKGLPSLHDLGGLYASYVLWIVQPDGSVISLGQVPVNGEDKVYDTEFSGRRRGGQFGLILTAEPHPAVSSPGLIVMRSFKPMANLGREDQISCLFTETDYDRPQPNRTEKEKKSIRKKPLEMYQAEYATILVDESEAENIAPIEFSKVKENFVELKKLYNRNGKKEEIGALASIVIGYAVQALNLTNKRLIQNRERREIKQRAETLDSLSKELIRAETERDRFKDQSTTWQSRYESANDDLNKVQGQLDEANRRNKNIEPELQQLRSENVSLNRKIDQLETDLVRARGAKDWPIESPVLENHLSLFGKVLRRENALVLTLNENRWEIPEEGKLSTSSLIDMEPLFVKLVEKKYLEIVISSFVTVTDGSNLLAQKVGDKRGMAIYSILLNKGVSSDRMKRESTSLQPLETGALTKKTLKQPPMWVEILVKPVGQN